MFEMLGEIFSYHFMVRSLVSGVIVSLCAALLGVSLVLKRYSMIGDGLSHVGFGSLAVSTALGAAPMLVTMPVVLLSAYLLLRYSNKGKVKGDASVAMISTSSLAIGVMVLSLSKGMTSDVNNYLFGSVLAISHEDMILCLIFGAIVLILYILFYQRIFSVTFDENFDRATGGGTDLCLVLLAMLTAVTIVTGMRVMGAMLISSLILFPALSAMQICKRYLSVTITSAIVSVVSYVLGLIISYLLGTPAGPSVVVVNLLIFLLCRMIGRFRAAKH